MSDWLSELSKNRRDWVTSTRLNDFEAGIRGSTVDKYADPAHFVYELLQNAEDQEAKRVCFRLEKDRLEFIHYGKRFVRQDVVSITGIGNSDKPFQANKIGRFGIGFKSVFAVSDRPEVYTLLDGEPFAFAIEDLVVPVPLTSSHELTSGGTRFVFPLKNVDRASIHQTIHNRLATLGAHTLLFLDHIETVEWESELAAGSYTCDRSDPSMRVLREVPAGGGQSETRRSRYLLHTREVSGLDSDRSINVRIAFRLNEHNQVVPEEQGTKLSVYFETEEQTGLRFRVHGPFLLTDNRANTKKNNRENAALVEECTRLLLDALDEMKNASRLGVTTLAALPNDEDNLPEFTQPIRRAVMEAVTEKPLIPGQSGGYARATDLAQGMASVRELIDDDALAFLTWGAFQGWAANVSRNPRASQFLRAAGVREWGLKELAEAVTDRFGGWNPSSEGQEWLARRKESWLQQFYAILRKAVSEAETESYELRNWQIIRLENGKHAKGPGTYFPPEKGKGYLELPRVKGSLIAAGNQSRRDQIRKLLTELGVQPIGEREEIAAILRKHYSEEGPVPNPKSHLNHIRRFLDWWSRNSESELFRHANIFFDETGSTKRRAEDCYLDEPFGSSGLHAIYEAGIDGIQKHALWEGYSELSSKGFSRFAAAVGVQARLEIKKGRVASDHPDFFHLHFRPGTRWTGSSVNEDYDIPSLSDLLSAQDVEISRLIWRTMNQASTEVLHARCRPNQKNDFRTAPSSLVITLSKAAWIPDKSGVFHRPRDLTRTLLPSSFPMPATSEWLSAVGFGDAERQQSETYRKRAEMAEQLGIPIELLERLDGLDQESRQSALSQFADLLDREASPEFPEHRSPNPDRRADRIRQRLLKAPPRTRSSVTRTERTSEPAARADAKTYLRDFYTNPAGLMVCQACHGQMPFQLSNGDFYFEAVELFHDARHEYRENYLALCPVCAAKFRHASDFDPGQFRDSLRVTSDLCVEMSMAGVVTPIRFVDDHRTDLLALADVESQFADVPENEPLATVG